VNSSVLKLQPTISATISATTPNFDRFRLISQFARLRRRHVGALLAAAVLAARQAPPLAKE
jgi:hypothetical protein